MTDPYIQPTILQINPYVGGEAEILGAKKIIKLSSNEGALGASPNAVKAFKKASSSLHRYPDGNARLLREAIAETHNLDANKIVCGSGSDELISLLCKGFCGPGDEVLHSQYGFLMYPISAMAAGATPKFAEEKNLTADVNSLLSTLTKNTKIIFLANPNNPTGTYLAKDDLLRLYNGIPKHIILVIDAAYAEYVNKKNYTEGNELVEHNNNVIVTRTFSKSHGLGGLRLGWAYGSQYIVDVLNRIRGPFNISSPAQAAGVASILDTTFAKCVHEHNLKWREWTKNELAKIGLKTPESAGNFLLISFDKFPLSNAKEAENFLKTDGILVRAMGSYKLPNCLRVSIGLQEEMHAFIESLSRFLKKN